MKNIRQILKKKDSDNEYQIGVFDGENYFTCDFKDIVPIMLTEEWILKLGFKETAFFLKNDFSPKIEVIAFIGKIISVPGIWVMLSQISIIIAPKSNVLQNKILWLLVWKTNFAIWGTASPTNAIGPTKAVILPANMLVANSIIYLVFL